MLQLRSQARDPLLESGRHVEQCFNCAVCALVCPVTRYGEGYDPKRHFVYDMFSSPEPAANPSLWSCSLCHRCYEVCPQDVNPPTIFESLREAAFENGWAPSTVVSLVETVIETGSSFPITAASKRTRARFNLPPFASTGVDEIRQIVENTGLQQILDRLKAKGSDDQKQ